MLAQEVAKRYAHGLFRSAHDKKLTDKGYEQLADLKAYLASDATLLNFLNAPQVLEENKLKLLRDVFSRRLDRLFVEFLVVLVHKHRARFLPEIIDEFARLVEAEKGVGRVTVITVVALGDKERTRLVERLTAKLKLKIVLEEKIDPRIIGGMIVITHSEIIDGSVRHGLDLIDERLRKVKVA